MGVLGGYNLLLHSFGDHLSLRNNTYAWNMGVLGGYNLLLHSFGEPVGSKNNTSLRNNTYA